MWVYVELREKYEFRKTEEETEKKKARAKKLSFRWKDVFCSMSEVS